jgi:PAS domain S-box-containing protein
LNSGAQRVSRGDLGHPIDVRSNDELGDLAASFNEMMEHRRKAEDALQASNALSRSIIETANDAFIAMDTEGRIIDWNGQAEKTFGRPRQEVIGQPLAEVIIPKQHRQAHQQGLRRFLETGEGPVLDRRVELTALRRSGEEFPVELTIWPVKTGGHFRFNAFLHDITERHRMVRRLATQKSAAAVLLESQTVGEAARGVLRAICEALGWDVGAIWITDPTANELRCMEMWHRDGASYPGFVRMSRSISFAPVKGLPGRVWESGQPAWIPDVTLDQNFPRSAHAANDGLHGAFAFPVCSGRQVVGVIEFFSNEIQEPDADLMRMMETLGNLFGQFVQRRRAESELADRVDELARSNEELERFAYVASHDLQEPLRTVTSYTQLLVQRMPDQGDADTREFMTFLTDAVRRMRDLIEGLLSYSRVAREEHPLERSDVNEILNTALGNLRGSIADSGAVVHADPLPTLFVNPQQMAQLFQNLIGNAIKFRGKAPPEIRIRAQRTEGEWQVSVSDNGIGIDPQYAEKIFILFQRLHTRDTYPGSGLGLAICKKIVERHGGRIWVESGKPGSIFRFTLPAK